jgi:hypothetical protein
MAAESMRSITTRIGTGGLLLGCAGLLVVSAAGCTTQAAAWQSATSATVASAATATAGATRSADASAIASPGEVRVLLSQFRQPEKPGDLGYSLLGADHNDIAAWTRGVVLANTNYGLIVHSLASQQSGIPDAALTDFDRLLASKGATATYDAIVDSQWRPDSSVDPADKMLPTLIPASTYMGLLFDRAGHLDNTYALNSVVTSETVATVTFERPGAPAVGLGFDLARDLGGGLRIVGVRGYAQFKRALAGTDLVEGLP